MIYLNKTYLILLVTHYGMIVYCLSVDRLWDDSLLEDGIRLLKEDLPLSDSAPGGMISYRKTLTISFFYKFFLFVKQKISSVHRHLSKDGDIQVCNITRSLHCVAVLAIFISEKDTFSSMWICYSDWYTSFTVFDVDNNPCLYHTELWFINSRFIPVCVYM